MTTDLTAETKAMFKSLPPPRLELFNHKNWEDYRGIPVEHVQEPQQTNELKPGVEPEVLNRHRYSGEQRNLRRMAVLRCLQSGMTNRNEIGKKLGLPAGTVWHDMLYWKAQKQ